MRNFTPLHDETEFYTKNRLLKELLRQAILIGA